MASSLAAAAKLAKRDSPEEQIRRIVAEQLAAMPKPEPVKPEVRTHIQTKRGNSVLLNGVPVKLNFVNAGDDNYPTLLRMCLSG